MKGSERLSIVTEGECHPYRRVDPDVTKDPPERHICTDCRHHKDNGNHQDNLEWRYDCLFAPRYEEHVNYVNGDTIFFDREGWEGLLADRKRWGSDFRSSTTEKDYFHPLQRYEPCLKRNTNGLCEDYEPPASLVVATKAARRWDAIRPTLVGIVMGGALALVTALVGLVLP